MLRKPYSNWNQQTVPCRPTTRFVWSDFYLNKTRSSVGFTNLSRAIVTQLLRRLKMSPTKRRSSRSPDIICMDPSYRVVVEWVNNNCCLVQDFTYSLMDIISHSCRRPCDVCGQSTCARGSRSEEECPKMALIIFRRACSIVFRRSRRSSAGF